MKKLNFLGIGPIIAATTFPWLAVSIFLPCKFKTAFTFNPIISHALLYAGWAVIFAGIIFYLATVPYLLKGLREGRLITSGTFYLCCNPLYTSIILFIIPGLSLILNSWFVLTTGLVAYITFKVFIKKEYAEMEEHFGDDYKSYRRNTPEFFPFPFRKLSGRSKA